MSTATNHSKIFDVVIMTVCVKPLIANQLIKAVEKMPWLVNASSFDTYISTSRRPSFSLKTKSADLCIAIVDFDQNPSHAAETAQYLTQILAGKVTIIALATNNDPALLLTAMRAGCSEFLYKPLEEVAVTQMLDRLAKLWSNSMMCAAPEGSIVSFFGVKGGVGTTTLAVHLAMYLVQCHQKRTLLIDNHPELGHACVYLGIDGSRYHFRELVRNVSRLDSELLRGFVATHHSGLEVLSSPDAFGELKKMDPESILKTFEFLRSEYDYVVVDGATPFDDINLAVIDLSTRMYLVATPEIGAIRNLSRCVEMLRHVDRVSIEKLQVIINRLASSSAINADEIEKAIKCPIIFSVPDSYTELVRSSNLGETISPKSKLGFATQVVKWSENLVGSPQRIAAVKKDKSIFTIWNKALLHQDS